MNKTILTLAAAAATCVSASAAGFTAGNVVVERLHDGATAISNASAAISLIEYSSSGGSAVQTINLPTSGDNRLTDSGSATSNGYFNIYGTHIAVPGYNQATGVASVASTNTKAVNTYSTSSGDLTSRLLLPTSGSPLPYNGNNFRSAITTDGSKHWFSGAGSSNSGGIWFYNSAAPSPEFIQVSTTVTNTRNIEIYNGNLAFSTGSGTSGIYTFNGLPETSGNTANLLFATGTGSSPYGFVLFDTNGDNAFDTAFVADDRTGTGGGLQKWTFDGDNWSNSYSLLLNPTGNTLASSGSGLLGLRGLTGEYDSVTGSFVLYGTTTETNNNRLVQIIDDGSTPANWSQIATAGTNYVFRGVDLAPVPEPSSFAALAGLGALGCAALRRRRRRA